MAKILFGAQKGDFWFCQDLLDVLEGTAHEVTKISDAGQLLEAMTLGQGDLVIIFGGPMPVGSLAQQVDNAASLIAGLQAVWLAREGGCQMPAIILETITLPQEVRGLSNITILKVPCDPGKFLGEVQELLA